MWSCVKWAYVKFIQEQRFLLDMWQRLCDITIVTQKLYRVEQKNARMFESSRPLSPHWPRRPMDSRQPWWKGVTELSMIFLLDPVYRWCVVIKVLDMEGRDILAVASMADSHLAPSTHIGASYSYFTLWTNATRKNRSSPRYWSPLPT